MANSWPEVKRAERSSTLMRLMRHTPSNPWSRYVEIPRVGKPWLSETPSLHSILSLTFHTHQPWNVPDVRAELLTIASTRVVISLLVEMVST